MDNYWLQKVYRKVNNIVHIFLLDQNNEGHMYTLCIEGDKEDILNELYIYSNDVRYVKSRDKGKKDLGVRKINSGTVVSCKYKYDKLNTFGYVPKNLPRDLRHKEVACNGD